MAWNGLWWECLYNRIWQTLHWRVLLFFPRELAHPDTPEHVNHRFVSCHLLVVLSLDKVTWLLCDLGSLIRKGIVLESHRFSLNKVLLHVSYSGGMRSSLLDSLHLFFQAFQGLVGQISNNLKSPCCLLLWKYCLHITTTSWYSTLNHSLSAVRENRILQPFKF